MTREHSYDPADGFPQIMPSLRYDDVGGALAWLSEVFGLREYLRWSSPDGVVHHAEMRVGNGFVELAGATGEQPSPRRLGHASSALVVLVDDVDSHYERARAGGATIIASLEDKPWGCGSTPPRIRRVTAGSSPSRPGVWRHTSGVRASPPEPGNRRVRTEELARSPGVFRP